METNKTQIDNTNLVDYLLKNYRKCKIYYSADGRVLRINNITITKVKLMRADGRPITDYQTEQDALGNIIKYNCFNIDGQLVSIDDKAWPKMLNLNKFCKRKYNLVKKSKQILSPICIAMVISGLILGFFWLVDQDIKMYEKRRQVKQEQLKEQLKKEIIQEYGLDTCVYQKTR